LDIRFLVIAFAFFAFANYARAFRFCSLDHTGNRILFWWNINQFYNFINATLPGGAGEAATAYVLRRYSGFNTYRALKILVQTRLYDLASVSSIFFLAAFLISDITPYRSTSLLSSVVLCFLSLLALIPAVERFFIRTMQNIPGRVAIINRLTEKVGRLAEFSEGHRKNSSVAVTMVQSLLVNGGIAVSVYFALAAFGISFTPVQGLYCFGVFTIFKMVPIQGIAGLGTQAAWWSLGLSLAGYNGPELIATGFIMYGTYYMFIGALGLPSMVMWLMNRKKAVAV
jgi:uncharacterized protein (TIRG00374 family)